MEADGHVLLSQAADSLSMTDAGGGDDKRDMTDGATSGTSVHKHAHRN